MNYYNNEGYADPTAFKAMCHVRHEEKMKESRRKSRPLIYICSPYKGDTRHNTSKARRYSKFAVKNCCTPIAPHLLFPQFMDDSNTEERETAMQMNMKLLQKCSEIWVFGDTVSEGMRAEIQAARRRHKKIIWFTDDLKRRIYTTVDEILSK